MIRAFNHKGSHLIRRSLMNTGNFALACAAVLLWCSATRAQDSKRVQDVSQDVPAVDASVHADFTEDNEQPALADSPGTRPGDPSIRWGNLTPAERPASQFWPSRTADVEPVGASGGDYAGRSPVAFSTSFVGGTQAPSPAIRSSSAPISSTIPKIDGASGKQSTENRYVNGFPTGQTRSTPRGTPPVALPAGSISPEPQRNDVFTPLVDREFATPDAFSSDASLSSPFLKTADFAPITHGKAKIRKHNRTEDAPSYGELDRSQGSLRTTKKRNRSPTTDAAE